MTLTGEKQLMALLMRLVEATERSNEMQREAYAIQEEVASEQKRLLAEQQKLVEEQSGLIAEQKANSKVVARVNADTEKLTAMQLRKQMGGQVS